MVAARWSSGLFVAVSRSRNSSVVMFGRGSGEVPRVLFLGLCLVFHYFSTGVVFPKIGFYFSRRAVAQALVEP